MYSPLEIEEKQNESQESSGVIEHEQEKEKNEVSTSCFTSPKLNLFSLFFIIAMMISSVFSLIPSMILLRSILNLTGRWYFGGVVVLPQLLEKMHVWLLIRRVKVHRHESFLHRSFSIPIVFGGHSITPPNSTNTHVHRRCSWRMIVFVMELSIMLLLSVLYLHIIPWLCKDVVISYFIGIDGTFSVDWDHLEDQFETIYHTSLLTGSFYVFSLVFGILALVFVQDRVEDATATMMVHSSPISTRNIDVNQASCVRATKLFRFFRWMNIALLLTMIVLLGICLNSAVVYLFTNRIPQNNNIGEHCDPLDTTECMLPFPSSFFTVKDETTETGFRVDVDLDAMTTLYRGPKVKHPIQLNSFDGFITSGPILFYLKGVKEGNGQGYKGTSRLIPPDEIELSITSQSMTLLLDVTEGVLLHHFAEIDSLDDSLPTIIVQPAYPLKHNHRYAVVLVDAVGANGEKLDPSPYLKTLLDGTNTLAEKEQERGTYFRTTILPSLFNAAAWLSEDSSIQMLFDFHTMSAEIQIGTTRKAIENSINAVRSESWERKVRVVKVEANDNCLERNQDIDRILHLEVDLPNFMKSNMRASLLDHESLVQGSSETSPVKVAVLVPCKVAAGIVPLRAVIQFGHGFLYSRQEILDLDFAHRVANDHGYLMFASNWRGMSYLDVPIIFKAFVSQPDLMASIRDNIIQGYANKAALQEFALNGLVELLGEVDMNIKPHPDGQLRSIFYGISQGGILGSAFSSLLAPYKLLDGSVIVSAGTPFSLLMSRSTIFPAYNTLLRLGLHNARHVRIFISIMQMLYDTVEVGGVLTSNTERVPTLLQQGLGDTTVTNIASDYMLRAYNASTFSSNPIRTFGVDIGKNESLVYATDLLYQEEYQHLTLKNSGAEGNDVHYCTRLDAAIVNQMVEFCNTGTFLDVCEMDSSKCIREVASC